MGMNGGDFPAVLCQVRIARAHNSAIIRLPSTRPFLCSVLLMCLLHAVFGKPAPLERGSDLDNLNKCSVHCDENFLIKSQFHNFSSPLPFHKKHVEVNMFFLAIKVMHS